MITAWPTGLREIDLLPPEYQPAGFYPGGNLEVGESGVNRFIPRLRHGEQDGKFSSHLVNYRLQERRLLFAITVEQLLEFESPNPLIRILRCMVAELLRMTGHLNCLALAAHGVGAFRVASEIGRDARLIHGCLHELSTTPHGQNYIVPGGFKGEIKSAFFESTDEILTILKNRLNYYEKNLINDSFFMARTRNEGKIDIETALDWGVTGPTLRASGVRRDLRKDTPYNAYKEIKFRIPIGKRGDIHDRFRVRFLELKQSINILGQITRVVSGRDYSAADLLTLAPEEYKIKLQPHLFGRRMILVGGKYDTSNEEVYFSIESASGELGCYARVLRENLVEAQLREPGFVNFQSLRRFAQRVRPEDLAVMAASLGLF